MRLTNTFEHLAMGLIGGAIGAALLRYVLKSEALVVFGAIGAAMALYAWENAQYQRNKKDFIRYRLFDSIVDFIAGYVGFSAAYWLIVLIPRTWF